MVLEHSYPTPQFEKHRLSEWARVLARYSAATAAMSELTKTKADYQQQFDAMELPSYKRYIEPLSLFIQHRLTGDENHMDTAIRDEQLQTPSLWYQLIPFRESENRVTMLDVSSTELAVDIQKRLAKDEIDAGKYAILVSEFLPNAYGGQIVIDDDGGTAVYFGEGLEEKYSSGEQTPKFSADNKRATRTFHYSFDDPVLRQIIYSAVQATHGVPGYYEFAVGRDDTKNGALRPISLDYRSDEQKIYRPATSPDALFIQ